MSMHAHELQIQLDDVLSCTGNCPGCALQRAERDDPENAGWSEDMRSLALFRVGEHLERIRPDRARLTFGVGDHMLCSDDYLSEIYLAGRAAMKPHVRERSVHVTFSFIARPERFIPRLERLASHVFLDTPLHPTVVLDPDLLHHAKLGERFAQSIRRATTLFDRLDLSLALSDHVVEIYSPAELCALAADCGAGDLAIAWTPTAGNAASTGNLDALAGWLLDFDEASRASGVSASFQPVFRGLLAGRGASAPMEALDAALPEHLDHYLEIDHGGALVARFEAVGDIAHGPRFGFPALGHIASAPLHDIALSGLSGVKRRILAVHSRHASCQTCPWLGACAVTGFHIPLSILPVRSGGQCPTVARHLFDHFDRQVQA